MKKLLLLIPFLFIACSTKPEVVVKTKYIMVKPSLPTYATEEFNKSLSYTFYNKGNKVCVKEWGDVCIPKDKMIELISYIKDLKLHLVRCNTKIENYLDFRKNFLDKNQSIKVLK